MPSVILATLDHPDAAFRVLGAAARLAELTAASRVNVLVIRTPPLSTITTEEVLTRQVEHRVRAEEQRRSDLLRASFNDWVSSSATGLLTEWIDVEGLADQAIDEWGRRADFVVMKRPTDRRPEQERRALHTALFDTGRPVLLVPPELPPAPFGRRIAIAWRDDGRTIKAVLSALRLAEGAEQIHVLAGARDTASPPRVPDILDEHSIDATLHVLLISGQQAFGEALLAAAHEVGADMLVMGAFARHPVRSLILGGVTRYMLSHADLPVLLRH
jgi:nucleotide-binding universal stress UspA family protein